MKGLYFLVALLSFSVAGCHETVEMGFSLVYYAGAGGEVDEPWNSIQVVRRGENGAEVAAVPNDGFVFYCWSDGVDTARRRDTNVQHNIFVTAFFVEAEPK